MDKIRSEGRSASVSFRFTGRQSDQATAFEAGIFRRAQQRARSGARHTQQAPTPQQHHLGRPNCLMAGRSEQWWFHSLC